MASPTLTKSWVFDVNNLPDSGNATTNAQTTLRGIKDKFKALSTNPWTVEYSSDGVAAGTPGDGVDRWSGDSDLVWSAGNHSWIVLTQTAIGSNFQICINLAGVPNNMAMVISPSAGFTGGTIGTRPTATDEFAYRSSAALWGRGLSPNGTIVGYHVMMSTDGECTRVLFTQNDKTSGCWIIDKLQDTPSGYTTPAFVMVNAANGTDPGPSLDYDSLREVAGSDTLVVASPNGITPFFSRVFMTSEGCRQESSDGGANGNSGGSVDQVIVANEINGEWEIYPIGVSIQHRPNQGKVGTIADVWFVPNDQTSPGSPASSGSCVTGATFNPSGTQDFVVMDVLAFPWNGSVPIVSGTYAGGKPPISASIPQSSNFTSFTSSPGIKDGSRVVITTEEIVDPTSIIPSGSYDRHRTKINYPYGRRRPRIGDFSEG